MKLRIAILFSLLAMTLLAQQGSFIPAPVLGPNFQTTPGAVPTTATDLSSVNTYLTSIVLCNTSVSSVTVSFQTKQATPIVLFTAAIAPTSNNYVINYPHGLWFPGGVTWVATATGVNGYVTASF